MLKFDRRKFIIASAINGVSFIISSIVVLLWSFLLVRTYSGQDSGYLLLSLSVAGIINMIDLGVSMGLTRVISMEREEKPPFSPENYFLSALSVTLILELVVGGLAVFIWSYYFEPVQTTGSFGFIVVFALSTQTILICSGALKGFLNFKAANLITTGAAILVYGIGVAMASSQQSVWHMLISMAIMHALVAYFAVSYTLKRIRIVSVISDSKFRLKTLFKVYWILLKISITYFPQMFAGLFFQHVQRFMISRYSGIDFVALISLAYAIATRLHAIINAFLEVIFPMASKIQKRGVEANAFCIKFGALAAVVYIITSGVAAGIVGVFIPGIFPVLLVFSIGVTFAVASAPAFHLLNGSGASHLVSTSSVLSPLLFACLVPAINYINVLDSHMLLPAAYAITMSLLLLQIVIMVRHHSKVTKLS